MRSDRQLFTTRRIDATRRAGNQKASRPGVAAQRMSHPYPAVLWQPRPYCPSCGTPHSSSGDQPAAPAPVAELSSASALESDDDARYLRPLAEQVAELERRAIAATLKANGGNKLATARQLGISRATLYERLENPDLKTDS